MKSYFIFTIVLTVAYLVYYAVIIVQDLYGKKGNSKPEEEVFDLGAPEDEQSVSVTESDTGFNEKRGRRGGEKPKLTPGGGHKGEGRSIKREAGERKGGHLGGWGGNPSEGGIGRGREKKKYFMYYALSLMRYSPKAAA